MESESGRTEAVAAARAAQKEAENLGVQVRASMELKESKPFVSLSRNYA